jgi:hypothetical protein
MASADAPDCKAKITGTVIRRTIHDQHRSGSAGEPFMPL